MRNRAFLKVVLLGLLTFALVPGLAGAASQGQDLTGMLSSSAAERSTAVSGPIIDISPATYDFGACNASDCFDFLVTNMGDMDLTIFGTAESNPGAGFTVTAVPGTLMPGESGTLTVCWTNTGSGPVFDNIFVFSDASNGDFALLVTAVGNTCPTFDAPCGDTTIAAFLPYHVGASASDTELDGLTYSYSSVPPLPLGVSGPTFNTATGDLDWTPNASGAGSYVITICVTDGCCETCCTYTLTVTSDNAPPVANANGPYSGVVGVGVAMTAAGSNDPDGSIVSYDWDFGDLTTGTGPTPSHPYSSSGTFIVTLTVTDDGSPALTGSATTTALIQAFVPGIIVQPTTGGQTGEIRTNGQGKQQFGIELTGSRPVTDIDAGTIRISTSYPNAGTQEDCGASANKTIKIGDLNKNLFGDLDFWVTASEIEPVLLHVPNGTTIELVVTARAFSDNALIRGTIMVTKKGPSSVTSAAAPNPFKPETSISYSVQRNGTVTIRIYSVGGQLVRSLREEFATAGTHEARWNGRDDAGRTVPSGIYFVNVRQGNEGSTTRVVLAR
jgi:hypothetical protein